MALSVLSVVSLLCGVAAAADVTSGYNAFDAAQVMANKASHSWEWGTAAEALLELYDSDLSVFGSNPFPGGKIPNADPSTFALAYAKQYINLNGQTFVADSAVGDPASLGVSAILLGQSNSAYLDASTRQADYILNQAPRWSNGAISHRSDVAEIWADNMAMSFPFLAYLAVQTGNQSLMATTVSQCGLQRDVLKTSSAQNWRHIIGPQSQDTGLWSTGNGWAAYGMVRVLHTLQKWSGSSSMTSQAGQLKGWIKEILDGAMQSSLDNGLLRNYLNDNGWFGEISGTALLSAAAYRMAVNDPGMFPSKYVQWADANRKALGQDQQSSGIFSPAVNPYNWKDTTKYNSGSPEGQAFAVYLYTAYRDCVSASVCASPASQASTISNPGIGPIDILTILHDPLTYSAMPAPTGSGCGSSPLSCDASGCQGNFNGLVKYPTCQAGPFKGCQCTATSKTCGSRQSCDLNGCNGKFNGLVKYAQCTGNFIGCNCTATDNTCGAHQSCDLNGCAGAFNGSQKFAQCTGNFEGCSCTATGNTCGDRQSCTLNGCAGAFPGNTKYPQCTGNFQGCQCVARDSTCGNPQSCDLNGCAGSFDLSNGNAYCRNNFVGCECAATSKTCGYRQSCDAGNCKGAFQGNKVYPQCTNFFEGCDCDATGNTCGNPQDCGLNGCNGNFDLSDGKAYCAKNFVGCECKPNAATCGSPQSCDKNHCDGAFQGNTVNPVCTNFFKGCQCTATSNTCGAKQSCDSNGCAGGYDSNGVARCQGNFKGCPCNPTSNTCGTAQDCDLNGCDGTFDAKSNVARCRGKFAGCVCKPVAATCGTLGNCGDNGCNGALDSSGNPVCTGNFYGCPCRPPPIWISYPPLPSKTQAPPPPQQTCYTNCDQNDCGYCLRLCGYACTQPNGGLNQPCLAGCERQCFEESGCASDCKSNLQVSC